MNAEKNNTLKTREGDPPSPIDATAAIRSEKLASLGIDAYNPADDPLVKTSYDLVGEIIVGMLGHVPSLGPF
jgi:hypothetical protein